MSNVLAFSNLLKIKVNSFIKSVNTFKGLSHRYEIFLKEKIVFINDSKNNFISIYESSFVQY